MTMTVLLVLLLLAVCCIIWEQGRMRGRIDKALEVKERKCCDKGKQRKLFYSITVDGNEIGGEDGREEI
jgi:hypothetical protein